MELEALTNPDDSPKLVRDTCFEVGWLLLSPDSWEYINIWTKKRGTVAIPELIKAVHARRDRLAPKVVSIDKFTTTRRK